MERRVLLAIFLSFLVLYVYQAVVVKPVPKPVGLPAGKTATTVPSTPGPEASTALAPAAPSAGPPAEAALPPKPVAKPLVADKDEHDIRIETQHVIAVFTNRGGRLKSWRLKHYLDLERQPQELIETRLASQPLPFTLRTTDESTTALLNGALYTASGEPSPGPSSSPVDLRF